MLFRSTDDVPARPPVVAVLPEVADHFGSLAAALEQNPEATDVYVVADTPVTGIAIAGEIRDDMAVAKLPLRIHYLLDRTLTELEAIGR